VKGNEPWAFMKGGEFFYLAERLLASQEGLHYVSAAVQAFA
jgi:hypothetical protein